MINTKNNNSKDSKIYIQILIFNLLMKFLYWQTTLKENLVEFIHKDDDIGFCVFLIYINTILTYIQRKSK